MKSEIDNFYKKKLKNGLTVLFEKRALPVVSVSASVKYGAAYESAKIKGISHFIEHLMFKGTKTRSQKEIAEEIEKKGGELNAFTSEEVTSYWNKLSSKHLNIGIEIASDLILNPKFDSVEFEKEKKVIIEEIKMYHDNPRMYVLDKIKELLYKKPFGMDMAGNASIIRKLTRQQVINLFNSVYTTDSMILTAVGNADFNDICKKAEKIYPLKARKSLSYEAKKINSELVEKRKGLEQAHFVFGFHAPKMQDKDREAYELAGAYLFGGMSSVLFQEIREKKGLAYQVKGEFNLGKEHGYVIIYVGALKEKIKQIKEIILKEIKNLKFMEQRELSECKEQLIGMKKILEEDSTDVMNMLMLEEISGKAEEYYKYEDKVSNIKLEDIKKIKLKGFSTFSLIPE